MAKEHINVRVDSGNLEKIDEIAQRDGTSRSAAVDRVLTIGLQKLEKQENDGGGESLEVIAALRDHIETLREQIAAKDAQIARINQTADQAQVLQMRLMNALPIAQEYGQERAQDGPRDAQRPEQAPGQQQPQGEAETAPQEEQRPQDGHGDEKRGFWARLWG